jgi:5-methylcytosine-specific restriction endonuclease McrA
MAVQYAYRTRRASPVTRRVVFARDDYTCQGCGFRPDVPDNYDGRRTLAGTRQSDGRRLWLELDHIMPHLHGGRATPENLQTLCCSCNARKGATV